MRRLFAVPVALCAMGVVLCCAPEARTQPGGFGKGPPGGQERKLVKDFDKNGDGWLNADERKPARDAAKKGGKGGFGPGGFGKGGPGGKGGFGKGGEAGKPGPKVTPAEVKSYPDAKLYDGSVLRTIFLEFESADWEQEIADFHGTDVDVPATATVDGKKYPNVGVHFRGMSSYMGVGAGSKRSLNLSFDMADEKQRLLGYKTLNLLNAHEDPSLMSSVLYSQIANKHIPAPKANFVKVVINGESWGVYASVQQFDKVFLKEHYGTTKGTRWKVRGSPGGRGGLEYFGEDLAQYKRIYEIKSGESDAAWKALVNFCKVLNQTPANKLEEALKPIADVDNILWFLALDVALINSDGYWTRASDYSIYLDEKNKIRLIPHDMNEAFRAGGGPGMGGPGGFPGGPGGGFFGPPPGEILPRPLQDQLRLTDEQKKQLEALQKDVDAKLDKVMTEEQRKQFKELKDRGPGGFGPPGGGFPGGPGGPGGGGISLDPLVGLNDTTKPLRSKLLAVPALRAKYLSYIKTIAEKDLDWKTLGPVVSGYRKLIEKEVEIDTRKLDSFEAFKRATDDTAGATGGRGGMSIRAFAEQRSKFLLNHAEVKKQ